MRIYGFRGTNTSLLDDKRYVYDARMAYFLSAKGRFSGQKQAALGLFHAVFVHGKRAYKPYPFDTQTFAKRSKNQRFRPRDGERWRKREYFEPKL